MANEYLQKVKHTRLVYAKRMHILKSTIYSIQPKYPNINGATEVFFPKGPVENKSALVLVDGLTPVWHYTITGINNDLITEVNV